MKEMSKGEGQYGMRNMDFQISKDQCAGEMSGKANEYIDRSDKLVKKEAKQLKSQRHMGRYD